jgi:hypothetical protein
MVNDDAVRKSSTKVTGVVSEYVIKKMTQEDDQKKAKPKADEPKSI